MAKRPEGPTALGMITGALGKFAAQQAVHTVIDNFAARIVKSPEIREHVAQVMYEREGNLDPWADLKPRDKEIWLRRVDCVVREISAMTAPRIGR